jgi:hypothetical protein
MPKLVLRCKDKREPRGDWLLSLKDRGVTLTDPEGEVRASFRRDRADSRLVLPSFWESVKDLGVKDDDGTVLWFYPEKEDIADIKEYLHGALAAQGPEAVAALRRKGWLLTVLGALIALGSLAVMVVTMLLAFSSPEGGTYFVTLGAVVAGLIVLSRGITALVRAGRADREIANWED